MLIICCVVAFGVIYWRRVNPSKTKRKETTVNNEAFAGHDGFGGAPMMSFASQREPPVMQPGYNLGGPSAPGGTQMFAAFNDQQQQQQFVGGGSMAQFGGSNDALMMQRQQSFGGGSFDSAQSFGGNNNGGFNSGASFGGAFGGPMQQQSAW